MRFDDMKLAVAYLRSSGLPEHEMRLFRTTFKQLPGFTPTPNESFKDEFNRFASSQGLSQHEKRVARVDAIRNEVIRHLLPDGVRIFAEQDDDNGYVRLDYDQRLLIYQVMCRKARKLVHATVVESLIELKQRPFVNILDLVDTYRTGQEVRTFENFKQFKAYTSKGRTVDLQMARETEFLAPLLQSLGRGPYSVDALYAIHQMKPDHAATLVKHEPSHDEQQEPRWQASSSILSLPRELSPSFLDPDMPSSRSRSPAPDYQRHQPSPDQTRHYSARHRQMQCFRHLPPKPPNPSLYSKTQNLTIQNSMILSSKTFFSPRKRT